MELFNMVFNKAYIYDTLFFNIKSVLEYPTLQLLVDNRPDLFDRWLYISEKYDKTDTMEESAKNYLKKAPYHPEFCKIVAITYGTVVPDNNQPKRIFKEVGGSNELEIVKNFQNILTNLPTELPQVKVLCGHNITGYDIPLFMKRLVLYRKQIEPQPKTSIVPKILKDYLAAKPWESSVIDTVNIWKFNGNEFATLMLISDFLGLKKNERVLPLDELSEYYWQNIKEKPQETISYISKQSLNQVNLVIQLMNELRQL